MVLRVDHVKKKQGAFVLDIPSLEFHAGGMVGLLGFNGAGKSTLFSLLSGHADPDQGGIYWCGKKVGPDYPELKKEIAYLPQESALPVWMTPKEALTYSAMLRGLSPAKKYVEPLMHDWGLKPYENKSLASCSHGMLKRVGLALLWLGHPQCILLDEPFTGLDVRFVLQLQKMLQAYTQKGGLVILSCHILPFVAELCNRILLIHHGRVVPLNTWQLVHNLEFKLSVLQQALISEGMTS